MASEEHADPTFELAAMLVSSARGAHEEGPMTASLRLLDAAGRLADLTAQPSPETTEFLVQLRLRAKEAMTGPYLESDTAYIAYLDTLVRWVADEVRRRENL